MKKFLISDKHLYILLGLFLSCIVLYYFGELINLFRWDYLRWDIFYTVHGIYRILFLVPILYSSYYYRLRGAILANTAALLIFLPRACFVSPYPDATLRMLIFNIVAVVISMLMVFLLDKSDKLSASLNALKQAEEKNRNILDQMYDSYFEVDPSGVLTFVNNSACHMIGYSREELVGNNYSFVVTKDDIDILALAFNEVFRTEEPNKGIDHRLIRKDGSVIFVETSISLRKDVGGEIIGFRSISRDITERRQIRLKLEQMATHDYLTGLPNRVLLIHRFTLSLALAHRNKARLAVMSLDLDRFKSINDAFGHEAGDQVLKVVSIRLTGLIRASDTVARIGGDEFILLMLETKRREDATAVAKKILDSFVEPLLIEGHQLYLSTSIGIAIYPEDAEDLETLIKKSDAAMYYSKSHGRNQFNFFNDESMQLNEN